MVVTRRIERLELTCGWPVVSLRRAFFMEKQDVHALRDWKDGRTLMLCKPYQKGIDHDHQT